MSPLERAARALVGDHPDRPWESLSPEAQPRWTEAARAVLQAIRDPSDDQLIEAQRAMFGSTHSAPPSSALTIGFQAMIDAALEEG